VEGSMTGVDDPLGQTLISHVIVSLGVGRGSCVQEQPLHFLSSHVRVKQPPE
jgi:hypothetical protein